MKTDIAERLEKIGNEMLALAAELKGDVRHELDVCFETELKHIEKTFGAQTRKVIETLALFGVEAEIHCVEKGPVVDRVVFGIPPGTRYSAVTACKDNIMGALRAHSIRIEAPMPGSDEVSVEFPHEEADREEIAWKPLASKEKLANFTLPMVVGKTCNGKDLIVELATLPHLLVGGATGQGKSTLLNSIICGLVANYSPDEVRFILSDTKCVEFTAYANLPHLVVPVITETRRFVFAIHWAVAEMEKRLKTFARAGCRNVGDFNAQAKEKVPYIVIIADECSDLVVQAGKELVPELSRLTAMARAAGIHLILATQRTDAKVLSGSLKANIPGRIAFKTAQSIDSRTVLDATGAEDLLGRGDMLMRGKDGQLVRAHGAIIRDPDIEAVVAKAEKKYRKHTANIELPAGLQAELTPPPIEPHTDEEDCDEAIELIHKTKRASTSHFQRLLGWGYNHAAHIIDLLEERGIIGPQVGAGSREVFYDKMPPAKKVKKAKAKKGKKEYDPFRD